MGTTTAAELLQLTQALIHARFDPHLKRLSWQLDVDPEEAVAMMPTLAKMLDGYLSDHQWGADRHQWAFTFEDSRLQLHYEPLCDSLWIQADNSEDAEVVAYLAQLWNRYDRQPPTPV